MKLDLLYSSSETHIRYISDWLTSFVWKKYMKGVEEHGGDLWTKSGLMHNLEEEIIDQAVYAQTVRTQLQAIALDPKKTAADAYRLLYNEEP